MFCRLEYASKQFSRAGTSGLHVPAVAINTRWIRVVLEGADFLESYASSNRPVFESSGAMDAHTSRDR